jgi:hypothetical protein
MSSSFCKIFAALFLFVAIGMIATAAPTKDGTVSDSSDDKVVAAAVQDANRNFAGQNDHLLLPCSMCLATYFAQFFQ